MVFCVLKRLHLLICNNLCLKALEAWLHTWNLISCLALAANQLRYACSLQVDLSHGNTFSLGEQWAELYNDEELRLAFLGRNNVTQVMSLLQVFVISKGIFPLQGAIVIQLWTVLWHVVLKGTRGAGFVIGVKKYSRSVKKHTQNPKIDWIWSWNIMWFERLATASSQSGAVHKSLLTTWMKLIFPIAVVQILPI